MEAQSEFFREFPGGEASGVDPEEDPAFQGLPPDIRDAIAVTARGAFGAPPASPSHFDAPTDPAVNPLLANSQRSFQQRFLESIAPKVTRASVEDAHIRAFDLTLDDDAREYERIMRDVYPRLIAEPGKWIFTRTPPQTIIDPASAKGFRVITTVEYCRADVRQGHDSVEFAVVGKDGSVSPSSLPAAK
jgi:hypothetical protein